MFSLKTAYRFTAKNKLQNIIIFFAILLGVSVQFFILTLSSMLKNILLDNVLLHSPHVKVGRINRKLNTAKENDLFNLIVADEDVKFAFYLNSYVGSITVSSNDLMAHPFILNVIDNDEELNYRELYGIGIEKTLVEGTLNDPAKKEIMLDASFANNIGAKIGDTVYFSSKYFSNPFIFTLTGTYDTGIFQYNTNFTYVTNKAFHPNSASQSSIIVNLVDPYNSTVFLERISPLINNPLSQKTDWQEVSERHLQMQTVQRAVIGTIEVLISIAIFIVVFNMLNYIIQKKYKEIGILKASGMQNGKLQLIFLLQTLIITLFAAISGLMVGSAAISLFAKYMVDPTTNEARFAFDVNPIDYIALFFLTMFAATLASLFSYRKTKNTSIVELLKL